MTTIRFFVLTAEEYPKRRYIQRYSHNEGVTSTGQREHAATFTKENDGYHRANVFHGIMQSILNPEVIQLEIADEEVTEPAKDGKWTNVKSPKMETLGDA